MCKHEKGEGILLCVSEENSEGKKVMHQWCPICGAVRKITFNCGKKLEFIDMSTFKLDGSEVGDWTLPEKKRHDNKRVKELENVVRAFLRAPHVGSDGPGSCTVNIQECHFHEARRVLGEEVKRDKKNCAMCGDKT